MLEKLKQKMNKKTTVISMQFISMLLIEKQI